MDLNSTERGTHYWGQEEFDLPAGKSLKIETSPEGEEILNVTVPEGKKFVGLVVVDYLEVDA